MALNWPLLVSLNIKKPKINEHKVLNIESRFQIERAQAQKDKKESRKT